MSKSITPKHRHAQRGVAAVEFALGAIVFFTFLFGTMELARLTFVWNTMYEANNRLARAAAMVSFNDTDKLDALRKSALFSDTMILDSAISYQDMRIDYLQADAATPVSPMPPCPAMNVANCLENPKGASCIQFVRVRLCAPNSNCSHATYSPMLALGGMEALNVNMPFFTAIVPVEALGMPGACS